MAAVITAVVAAAENPQAATPGQTVTLTGTGFTPGETVAATLHTSVLNLMSYTATSDGTVSITATVPEGTSAGRHTIVLTGARSGYAQQFRVTVGFRAHPSAHAVTASAVTVGAALAGAALLVSAAVWSARRRRRTRAAS